MLTRDDLIKYHQQGFIGPFTAFDRASAAEYGDFFFKNIIEKIISDPAYLSNVHVISKTVVNVISASPIADAVKKLSAKMFYFGNPALFQKGQHRAKMKSVGTKTPFTEKCILSMLWLFGWRSMT